MTDIKRLKSHLDRSKVMEIMQFLGYEFNRRGFTSLRDERTPSTSINREGYIKDFGTGWGGDIFALLVDYKGLSFKEALNYIEEVLNV